MSLQVNNLPKTPELVPAVTRVTTSTPDYREREKVLNDLVQKVIANPSNVSYKTVVREWRKQELNFDNLDAALFQLTHHGIISLSTDLSIALDEAVKRQKFKLADEIMSLSIKNLRRHPSTPDFLSEKFVHTLKQVAVKTNEKYRPLLNYFKTYEFGPLNETYQTVSVLNWLLQVGTSVDNHTIFGKPFIRWAFEKDNDPLVKLLLLKGADITALFRPLPCHELTDYFAKKKDIPENNLGYVKRLIALGAELKKDLPLDKSLAGRAISAEDPELLRFLLDNGFSTEAQDKSGYTMLLKICSRPFKNPLAQLDMIHLLAEKDANFSVRTVNTKKTCLEIAKRNNAPEKVIDFLEASQDGFDFLTEKLDITYRQIKKTAV